MVAVTAQGIPMALLQTIALTAVVVAQAAQVQMRAWAAVVVALGMVVAVRVRL